MFLLPLLDKSTTAFYLTFSSFLSFDHRRVRCEGSITLGRDLEAARKAYKGGDLNAMIAAHDHKSAAAEEKHASDSGDFIKSLVFGGLDGIITTFAIVCAAIGADLSKKTVIIMGLANLMVRHDGGHLPLLPRGVELG